MRQIDEAYISELMNKVAEGERVIAISVPTRAFRVVLVDNRETTFRIEQLSRQAGDKWIVLATCQDLMPWKSYWKEALPLMCQHQKTFALEMRKIEVERNRLKRELDITGKLINV